MQKLVFGLIIDLLRNGKKTTCGAISTFFLLMLCVLVLTVFKLSLSLPHDMG